MWEVYLVTDIEKVDFGTFMEYDGTLVIVTEDPEEARAVLEETLRGIKEDGEDDWLGACCYNTETGEEMFI